MVSTALLGDVNSGLVQGLGQEDCARVHAALDYAAASYGERVASSGQGAFEFSLGAAGTLAYLNTDAETRIAGLLFELALMDPSTFGRIEERFGP
ncbi:MAG TPA: GTP pyrophosphokinase, partial [Massilia timonae]|nr:GTP pyrophosphokinase [Massilia timonae]